MFGVEPECMYTTRRSGAGLAALALGVAALVAGCGGTSTKATPVAPAGSVATTASTVRPDTGASTPTSTRSGSAPGAVTTVAPAPHPSAAQLATVSAELSGAGTSLTDSQSAITASNVNAAKSQEGSAP